MAEWLRRGLQSQTESPKNSHSSQFRPDFSSLEINELETHCELACVTEGPQPVGFDRIERGMALAFAERPSGWPVGPELRGPAFSCPTPTVQVVRVLGMKGAPRYVVHTLFPFRRTDRRHPPSPALTLHRARRFALARLTKLAGGEPVKLGRGLGIELARGGKHFGLEVLQ